MKAGGVSFVTCWSGENCSKPAHCERRQGECGAIRQRFLIRLHRVQPWVAEDDEVRTAADALDGIRRTGVRRFGHRGRRRREVPPRREAHHPDAIGRHTELRGARTHESNRPASVDERGREEVVLPQPVLEHEGGHASCREPVGDLTSFEIGRESPVGTPGGHDHRRPVAVTGMHAEHRERRHVGVRGSSRARGIILPQAVRRDTEERIRRPCTGGRHRLRRRGSGEQ